MLIPDILKPYLQAPTGTGDIQPNLPLIAQVAAAMAALGYTGSYGVVCCEVCGYQYELFESVGTGERVCLFADGPSTEALWLWPLENGFMLRYDNGFCAGEATCYGEGISFVCDCHE